MFWCFVLSFTVMHCLWIPVEVLHKFDGWVSLGLLRSSLPRYHLSILDNRSIVFVCCLRILRRTCFCILCMFLLIRLPFRIFHRWACLFWMVGRLLRFAVSTGGYFGKKIFLVGICVSLCYCFLFGHVRFCTELDRKWVVLGLVSLIEAVFGLGYWIPPLPLCFYKLKRHLFASISWVMLNTAE